jgi:hypothetical protein
VISSGYRVREARRSTASSIQEIFDSSVKDMSSRYD